MFQLRRIALRLGSDRIRGQLKLTHQPGIPKREPASQVPAVSHGPRRTSMSQCLSSFLPLFSLSGPRQSGPRRMHDSESGFSCMLVSQPVQQSRCRGPFDQTWMSHAYADQMDVPRDTVTTACTLFTPPKKKLRNSMHLHAFDAIS